MILTLFLSSVFLYKEKGTKEETKMMTLPNNGTLENGAILLTPVKRTIKVRIDNIGNMFSLQM